MLQEKKIDLGRVTLSYMEGPPSGPPLVLLYGIPGSWQEFLPVLPALCLRWHVFALNFRGHGKSSRVPGEYHSKHHVLDVISFLKQCVEKPAALFGLSSGGLFALRITEQSPERVWALILGDSPLDLDGLLALADSPEFTSRFSALRALAGSDISIPELAAKLAEMPIFVPGKVEMIRYGDRPGVSSTSLRQWAMVLRHLDPGVLEYHAEGRIKEYLEGWDIMAMFSTIKCPVLLLQGDPSQGGMMTNASVEYAISQLENGTHVLIESHGHNLGLDIWEVSPLLRAVSVFLESLR
jgi:pimeloyl-ACP methyl ester carboxylesterase